MSNKSWLKMVTDMYWSKGVSIRATSSSKYSVTPLNTRRERVGRIVRACGSRVCLALSGRDQGDRKSRESDSSRVRADRQVTIASGEMYPECGMFQSQRLTRWGADKSSFGNAGNAMFPNQSLRRCGTDPPKNESEITGAISPCDQSIKSLSAGNGTCIPAASLPHTGLEEKLGTSTNSILDTRSLSFNASTTSFAFSSVRMEWSE